MAGLFISYAHLDRSFKEMIESQLQILLRLRQIPALSDDDIVAGLSWKQELERLIDESRFAVLLISKHFLNSEWCQQEMAYLAQNQERITLFPVLLGPCPWDDFDVLREIEFVSQNPPNDEKDEQGCLDIAKRIKTALEKHEKQDERIPSGQDAWSLIEQAARSGRFTPILGPGCYEVTEATREAREHIRERVGWILTRLGEDTAARSYVESLVSSNFKVSGRPSSGSETPVETWRQSLIDFQVILARLGAQGCSLMGQLMVELPRGFTDVRTLYASTANGSDLVQRSFRSMRDLFFQATRKAQEIHASAESPRHLVENLGIRGILEQLVMLTCIIFFWDLRDEDCDADSRDWKDDCEQMVKAAENLITPSELAKRPGIALAEIEWLGDLLWHTIRFEAPMYPSPDDLAFQLSVCLDTPIRPRKERMSIIAELADQEKRTLVIRKWFRVYGKRSTGAHREKVDFYDSLAKALLIASERLSAAPVRGGARNAALSHMKPKVIAISTNFDTELESALDRYQRSYSIVFPVFNKEKGLDWVLRRITWSDEGRERENVLLGKKKLSGGPFGSLVEERILWPLVVKLYGSPLMEPPEGCSHRLSISDLDFINAIIAPEAFWPPGLRELLGMDKEKRVLCFLGYPLADVASRLRLSEHVNRGTEEQRTLLVLDFPKDPLRHALLVNMKVNLLEATIEQLATRINEWFPDPLPLGVAV